MKKLIPLMLAGILSGCAGNASDANAASTDPAAEAQNAINESYEVTPEDQGVAEMVDAMPAAKGEVKEINAEQFKSLVADYTSTPEKFVGKSTAIVDFWAPWCGPCRQQAPILKSVADRTGVTVYKVNIDNYPEIARAYGVQGIPTLLFCKPGTPITSTVGLTDEATLIKVLDL